MKSLALFISALLLFIIAPTTFVTSLITFDCDGTDQVQRYSGAASVNDVIKLGSTPPAGTRTNVGISCKFVIENLVDVHGIEWSTHTDFGFQVTIRSVRCAVESRTDTSAMFLTKTCIQASAASDSTGYGTVVLDGVLDNRVSQSTGTLPSLMLLVPFSTALQKGRMSSITIRGCTFSFESAQQLQTSDLVVFTLLQLDTVEGTRIGKLTVTMEDNMVALHVLDPGPSAQALYLHMLSARTASGFADLSCSLVMRRNSLTAYVSSRINAISFGVALVDLGNCSTHSGMLIEGNTMNAIASDVNGRDARFDMLRVCCATDADDIEGKLLLRNNSMQSTNFSSVAMLSCPQDRQPDRHHNIELSQGNSMIVTLPQSFVSRQIVLSFRFSFVSLVSGRVLNSGGGSLLVADSSLAVTGTFTPTGGILFDAATVILYNVVNGTITTAATTPGSSTSTNNNARLPTILVRRCSVTTFDLDVPSATFISIAVLLLGESLRSLTSYKSISVVDCTVTVGDGFASKYLNAGLLYLRHGAVSNVATISVASSRLLLGLQERARFQVREMQVAILLVTTTANNITGISEIFVQDCEIRGKPLNNPRSSPPVTVHNYVDVLDNAANMSIGIVACMIIGSQTTATTTVLSADRFAVHGCLITELAVNVSSATPSSLAIARINAMHLVAHSNVQASSFSVKNVSLLYVRAVTSSTIAYASASVVALEARSFVFKPYATGIVIDNITIAANVVSSRWRLCGAFVYDRYYASSVPDPPRVIDLLGFFVSNVRIQADLRGVEVVPIAGSALKLVAAIVIQSEQQRYNQFSVRDVLLCISHPAFHEVHLALIAHRSLLLTFVTRCEVKNVALVDTPFFLDDGGVLPAPGSIAAVTLSIGTFYTFIPPSTSSTQCIFELGSSTTATFTNISVWFPHGTTSAARFAPLSLPTIRPSSSQNINSNIIVDGITLRLGTNFDAGRRFLIPSVFAAVKIDLASQLQNVSISNITVDLTGLVNMTLGDRSSLTVAGVLLSSAQQVGSVDVQNVAVLGAGDLPDLRNMPFLTIAVVSVSELVSISVLAVSDVSLLGVHAHVKTALNDVHMISAVSLGGKLESVTSLVVARVSMADVTIDVTGSFDVALIDVNPKQHASFGIHSVLVTDSIMSRVTANNVQMFVVAGLRFTKSIALDVAAPRFTISNLSVSATHHSNDGSFQISGVLFARGIRTTDGNAVITVSNAQVMAPASPPALLVPRPGLLFLFLLSLDAQHSADATGLATVTVVGSRVLLGDETAAPDWRLSRLSIVAGVVNVATDSVAQLNENVSIRELTVSGSSVLVARNSNVTTTSDSATVFIVSRHLQHVREELITSCTVNSTALLDDVASGNKHKSVIVRLVYAGGKLSNVPLSINYSFGIYSSSLGCKFNQKACAFVHSMYGGGGSLVQYDVRRAVATWPQIATTTASSSSQPSVASVFDFDLASTFIGTPPGFQAGSTFAVSDTGGESFTSVVSVAVSSPPHSHYQRGADELSAARFVIGCKNHFTAKALNHLEQYTQQDFQLQVDDLETTVGGCPLPTRTRSTTRGPTPTRTRSHTRHHVRSPSITLSKLATHSPLDTKSHSFSRRTATATNSSEATRSHDTTLSDTQSLQTHSLSDTILPLRQFTMPLGSAAQITAAASALSIGIFGGMPAEASIAARALGGVMLMGGCADPRVQASAHSNETTQIWLQTEIPFPMSLFPGFSLGKAKSGGYLRGALFSHAVLFAVALAAAYFLGTRRVKQFAAGMAQIEDKRQRAMEMEQELDDQQQQQSSLQDEKEQEEDETEMLSPSRSNSPLSASGKHRHLNKEQLSPRLKQQQRKKPQRRKEDIPTALECAPLLHFVVSAMAATVSSFGVVCGIMFAASSTTNGRISLTVDAVAFIVFVVAVVAATIVYIFWLIQDTSGKTGPYARPLVVRSNLFFPSSPKSDLQRRWRGFLTSPLGKFLFIGKFAWQPPSRSGQQKNPEIILPPRGPLAHLGMLVARQWGPRLKSSHSDVDRSREFLLAPFFVVGSFALNIIATTIIGAAMQDPRKCDAASAVLFVVSVLSAIFAFAVRPFLVPAKTVWLLVLETLGVGVSLTALPGVLPSVDGSANPAAELQRRAATVQRARDICMTLIATFVFLRLFFNGLDALGRILAGNPSVMVSERNLKLHILQLLSDIDLRSQSPTKTSRSEKRKKGQYNNNNNNSGSAGGNDGGGALADSWI